MSATYKLKPAAKYKSDAAQLTSIQARAAKIKREMSSNLDKYEIREKAFGAHHVLRAHKLIALNMSNVTGDQLEHPQIFARPDAKYDDGSRAGKDENGLPTDEVNQYGEVMQDIVVQKNINGDLPDPRDYKKPRKLLNMKDIIDYPNYLDLMHNIALDWQGLAEDIRYGLHHPKSRTVGDYVHAFQKKVYPEWGDLKIPYTSPPTDKNQALDLRLLANPSLNFYWGRRKFNDPTPPLENPWPAVSSVGLGKYLKLRVERDIKDPHLRHEFLQKTLADSGVTKKDLSRSPPWKIGVRLAEAAKGESSK